jgi:hypothetical protein
MVNQHFLLLLLLFSFEKNNFVIKVYTITLLSNKNWALLPSTNKILDFTKNRRSLGLICA